MNNVAQIIIDQIVAAALQEDLGHGVDSTSQALIPEDVSGTLVIRAREEGVLCGMAPAAAAFTLFDPNLEIAAHMKDGDALKAGDIIMTVKGAGQSILTAERTALNFLMHLSGIATETAKYAEAVKGTKTVIASTRKTLPGMRLLQKYAVCVGGGKNHRFGLDDAILIKDNHIALAGSVGQAIEKARIYAGHMMKIEIEVDDLTQLEEAMEHKVDAVLLDNMGPEELKEAVALIDGRALAEASGGITLEKVRAIAESGVDIISVGALTHSVKALDLGLDIAFDG